MYINNSVGQTKCQSAPRQTTKSFAPQHVEREWRLIDAKGIILGRLASQIANMLRGKDSPLFTPHADLGDQVVVINARHIALSGKKLTQKEYHRHTGHPGGLKTTTPKRILEGQCPERVLEKAVLGMLPKTSLGKSAFGRLRVYADEYHPHEAQQPLIYDFAGKNPKNMAGSNQMSKKSSENTDLVHAIRSMFNEQESKLGGRIDNLESSLGGRIDTLHDDFVGLRSDVNERLNETNSLLKQLISRFPK
jgi:large subunit ribosomal protein L13